MVRINKIETDKKNTIEKTGLTKLEIHLLDVLRDALHPSNEISEHCILTEAEWEELLRIAARHSILSLLYQTVEVEGMLSEKLKRKIEINAKATVLQQYRLLFLSRYLLDVFRQNHINMVLLKGVGMGAYYPVPELRKSGDVDLLLLEPEKLKVVTRLMNEKGFRVNEEQMAHHHTAFVSSEGIEIEIHTMLAEPFDNAKTNRYLDRLIKDEQLEIETLHTMGEEIVVLAKPYYAYELLLHMLQHFLRAGFGLKLLCDWVMFWQQDTDNKDKNTYLKLVEDSGMKKFSDMITMTCVAYLGLPENSINWMGCDENYPIADFIKEVLEAEEFGRSSSERMVVMRGTGIMDLVKEFHHQMHLNFPKAGKCFLLWPVLWIRTLVRFLKNNKMVRNTTTKEILKEAKRRSQLMEKLELFQ